MLKDIGDFWGNHYLKLTDFIDKHKYAGYRYYDKIRRAIGQDNPDE